MNNKKPFLQTKKLCLVLSAALLTTLTGCVNSVEGPQPVTYAEPVFAVQDDYVYYPEYGCYYSVSRHQYAYREGNRWVARPAPPRVSVSVLMASPSVRMNFHDSPANHHAQVVKQYPKNWRPSGSNQGQKHSQDQHDDHGYDGGR